MDFGRRANALSRSCKALRAIRGRFGIGTGIKFFVPIMLRRQADLSSGMAGFCWTILLEREYFFVQQNVRIPMPDRGSLSIGAGWRGATVSVLRPDKKFIRAFVQFLCPIASGFVRKLELVRDGHGLMVSDFGAGCGDCMVARFGRTLCPILVIYRVME